MARRSPSRDLGVGSNMLALGLTFGFGVIVFVVAGIALDRWLGLTPLFTIIGTLVGTALSILNVYWRLIGPQDGDEE